MIDDDRIHDLARDEPREYLVGPAGPVDQRLAGGALERGVERLLHLGAEGLLVHQQVKRRDQPHQKVEYHRVDAAADAEDDALRVVHQQGDVVHQLGYDVLPGDDQLLTLDGQKFILQQKFVDPVRVQRDEIPRVLQ